MSAVILPQQMPGVIVIHGFLFLSTAALLSVVARVLYLHLARLLSKDPGPTPRAFVFFGSQLGHYAACLLLANLINCIAGIIGLPFLFDKAITEGNLCTIQAVLMQFGNASNGYFTAAIAVHTFNSLVLRRRQSALICFLFIAFGWAIAAAVAVAPLAIQPQPYGISGLSCGIKTEEAFLSFLLHLLPIFIASLLSAILYSLIFLALRGTLRIRGGVQFQLNPDKRLSDAGDDYQAFVASLARNMLWFPIAYVALLVPYSVTRLLLAGDQTTIRVPFEVMVMSYCLWFLLGAVNVFILYQTFCILAPAIDSKSSSERDLEKSFSATKNDRFSVVPGRIIEAPFSAGIRHPTVKPFILHHERTTSQDSASSGRHLLAAPYRSPSITSLAPSAQLGYTFSPRHSPQPSWDQAGLPPAPRLRPQVSRVAPPARDSSLPLNIEELDVAAWVPRPTQSPRVGQQLNVRLSAVAEAIPHPSPSAASPILTHSPTHWSPIKSSSRR